MQKTSKETVRWVNQIREFAEFQGVSDTAPGSSLSPRSCTNPTSPASGNVCLLQVEDSSSRRHLDTRWHTTASSPLPVHPQEGASGHGGSRCGPPGALGRAGRCARLPAQPAGSQPLAGLGLYHYLVMGFSSWENYPPSQFFHL